MTKYKTIAKVRFNTPPEPFILARIRTDYGLRRNPMVVKEDMGDYRGNYFIDFPVGEETSTSEIFDRYNVKKNIYSVGIVAIALERKKGEPKENKTLEEIGAVN